MESCLLPQNPHDTYLFSSTHKFSLVDHEIGCILQLLPRSEGDAGTRSLAPLAGVLDSL